MIAATMSFEALLQCRSSFCYSAIRFSATVSCDTVHLFVTMISISTTVSIDVSVTMSMDATVHLLQCHHCSSYFS